MKIKTNLSIIFLLFVSIFTYAQTSDMGFSFQGYAIDPDGKAIGSTAITVRFTISPGGFTEEHALTTDAFGVFTAIVGNSSTSKNDEFEKIDFTLKGIIYSLKVEVKKTVGGSYTTISDAQMNAVPYARYAFNGVPVGTIIAYGGSTTTIPDGWLLCDGATKAQSAFPQLYTIIGGTWGSSGSDFNVPDLRGVFLRGVNGSRTGTYADANTSRTLGSMQGDDNKSHNHGAGTLGANNAGDHGHQYNDPRTGSFGIQYAGGTGTTKQEPSVNTTWTTTNGAHTHSISGTSGASGGSETRPKNAAVHYIIKY